MEIMALKWLVAFGTSIKLQILAISAKEKGVGKAN